MSQTEQINLRLVTSTDAMVLSRCLQVLSRRDYRLLGLELVKRDDTSYQYLLKAEGDKKWQAALPALLEKLPDVKQATQKGEL